MSERRGYNPEEDEQERIEILKGVLERSTHDILYSVWDRGIRKDPRLLDVNPGRAASLREEVELFRTEVFQDITDGRLAEAESRSRAFAKKIDLDPTLRVGAQQHVVEVDAINQWIGALMANIR